MPGLSSFPQNIYILKNNLCQVALPDSPDCDPSHSCGQTCTSQIPSPSRRPPNSTLSKFAESCKTRQVNALQVHPAPALCRQMAWVQKTLSVVDPSPAVYSGVSFEGWALSSVDQALMMTAAGYAMLAYRVSSKPGQSWLATDRSLHHWRFGS